MIKILDVKVNWEDGYQNSPNVKFLVDQKPNFDVYEKRPSRKETLSGDQVLIVGSTMATKTPGWHVYWSEDDGFAWFFTWGGKPDDGFGRWKRTITLSDGSEEEIVGGWHVGPQVAQDAGFKHTVDTAYQVGEWKKYSGGMACFITHERFRAAAEEFLPDTEVIDDNYGSLTIKWKNQMSKKEFMDMEWLRQSDMRTYLEQKYGKEWWRECTDAERAKLKCGKYSELGG